MNISKVMEEKTYQAKCAIGKKAEDARNKYKQYYLEKGCTKIAPIAGIGAILYGLCEGYESVKAELQR